MLATLLGAVSPAQAQSIVDARRVEFRPSPQHSSLDETGQPIVARYSIDVFVAGGVWPVASADLGKPVPDADGLIRIDFVSLLPLPLASGVTYEALVEAIGSGGRSGGVRTNTFAFGGIAVCAPSVTPLSQSFAAAGGVGTSTVTAGSGCVWSAASNASWITVSGGGSRTGSGTVGFTVAANTTAAGRTGTLTIAGATFTVTQAGASCSYSVSPTTLAFGGEGGTGISTVSAPTGCAWNAASNASWIAVTGGTSGSGNGTVGFTVAANSTTGGRSGTLTIAGTTLTVTQGAPGTCTTSISPTTRTFTSDGGSGNSTVTAAPTCPWEAFSNVAWVAMLNWGPGKGTGTVTFIVATNSSGVARTGTLTIAGKTFTVNQNATATCSYSVSPQNPTVGASTTTVALTVVTEAECRWSSSGGAPWITLSGSSYGTGTATLLLAPNLTKTARSATVTIAGRAVIVTQSGRLGAPVNVRVLR